MTGRAILTKDDVLKIKERIWNNELQAALAEEYKVQPSTISRICSGKQYWVIPWPDGTQGPLPKDKAEELHLARRVQRQGASISGLLRQTGVSPRLVAKAIEELVSHMDEADEEALDAAFSTSPEPDVVLKDWDDCVMVIGGPASKLAKKASASPKTKKAIQTILSTLSTSQQTIDNVERLLPNMLETLK